MSANEGLNERIIYMKLFELAKELSVKSKVLMDILNENLCLSIKDLKLTGNDIKDLGLKGKDIGIMLNLLLQNVIEEKLQNNKKDLISFAKRQL